MSGCNNGLWALPPPPVLRFPFSSARVCFSGVWICGLPCHLATIGCVNRENVLFGFFLVVSCTIAHTVPLWAEERLVGVTSLIIAAATVRAEKRWRGGEEEGGAAGVRAGWYKIAHESHLNQTWALLSSIIPSQPIERHVVAHCSPLGTVSRSSIVAGSGSHCVRALKREGCR